MKGKAEGSPERKKAIPRKMMGKDGKAMPRKGGKSLENQKNDEGEGWKSHAQERG